MNFYLLSYSKISYIKYFCMMKQNNNRCKCKKDPSSLRSDLLLVSFQDQNQLSKFLYKPIL